MSAGHGLLLGFLGLTALEATLSTKGATGRLSGGFASVAAVFDHLTDPTIPAIPDRSTGTTTSTPAASPGAALMAARTTTQTANYTLT